ncbi:hypothetical protein AQUCO_04300008v1 [Aquilegia coerulea]|uniref:J domain-containing protein n=1 Tax=Aquilegia coerulea TaxID=218851 RepID=A0A2G5CNB1_AQUCA|nr:hypothetical protein AQUCO_04300008v1 [Aquilegia coerulea]
MNQQSKLEALRCKEMAEKMINNEDYMGARDKLIQAKKLLPSLDNIESMLTVCDVLSASSLEFPGCKIDYYWILQLKHSANESDLRTQSQKLVSVLQPIKKFFPGTEMALHLVKSAFVMLSDKEKRAVFDLKRVESWDSFGSLYSKEFFDNASMINKDVVVFDKNKDVVVSAQSSSGNKRVSMSEVSDGSNGEAHGKKARHSEDDTLLVNADESRVNVIEVDRAENSMSSQMVTDGTDLKSSEDVIDEKPESKFYNFENNRKEEVFEVGQIWAAQHQEKFPHRYARINLKSNSELSVTWLKPVPFMEDERRWCEAGFPVACGSFELDPEMTEEKVSGTKVFSQMCSWVHGVTSEQFEIYPKAGEVWAVYEDWDLSEWSSNLEIMNGCKFKIVEILKDYSKYVGVLVTYLVEVEGFSSIYRRDTDEGNQSSFQIPPNSLYMFSHNIPAYRYKGGEIDRVEDGMIHLDPLALTDYAVDINSFEEQSSSDVSCVDHALEYIPPMRPSSDTPSLKLNWRRNDFSVGQVWAVYSGKDDMPRRYALINNVISNSQVRVTFLEPHPILDHEICWEKESLPIVCGIFRVGNSVHNLEMSWFSHSVKCQRSKTQSYYRIYPRKGEIWAMYTNWNKKWKQSEFNNYQYRVVEILDDFTEASGTRVARLVEVKGCMTFFQRHRYDGFELIRTVSKTEILSFSHRIPAFKVPGIERYDIPESSLHLEPDALPPRSKK